jgi:hypothetical protein
MGRRGTTYADRGGVGPPFMAVNADLSQQFEFVQHSWANDPHNPQSFDRDSGGIDQMIGPRTPRTPVTLFPGRPGRLGELVDPIPAPVMMLGGEYVFPHRWRRYAVCLP